MEQGTDNMSATQMEAFEKLKRELGDLNKIEKEVKKSTKRRQQFETVVHKAPVLTTSDVVDLSKDDSGDSNSNNTNKKIISLSSVKSDAFNNKKNKKVDDFLQRDLDDLSGIGSNRKKSFSNKKNKNKKGNQKKITIKKKYKDNNKNQKKGKTFDNNNNNKKKRKKSSSQHKNNSSYNQSNNRFDKFLTMSLDDLTSRGKHNKKSKRRRN